MVANPLRIYVRLLNEGVDVWRPVEAIREGSSFRIVGPAPQPPFEEWEYPLGALVVCELQRLSGGDCLVAIALTNQ